MLCTGIPQQKEDRNRMHVLTTPMTLATSDINLVNFGPVTSELAGAFAPGGLHAVLCHAFLVLNSSVLGNST